ncbi:rifin PIR protein, putative [Plasmodium reichenowi]|uniref:Rifin PIR protein, putative n=1 Tax=Plasmodium reichenowi TaxID=5854 RepID=A0A2P9DSL8_PLARE|nr:rifin PIR protein, putative [Plasmodium reichenowi]
MKQHYSKILLFLLPLNILVTSYHVYNKNKPSITSHHTPIYTSRLLSECDTESSIYDNDEEIISVKEIFDRQTSQRFEEYEERMKEKRQKRKEQRDKNIQKIIQKDKMEKNLAEKIEKGCLMCGCGLGSVAGSVGLFGGIAINIWKNVALDVGIKEAIKAAAAEISAAANAAGAAEIMKLIKSTFFIDKLGETPLQSIFTTKTYTNASVITQAVQKLHFEKCTYDPVTKVRFPYGDGNRHIPICRSVWQQTQAVSKTGERISSMEVIGKTVQNIASDANGVANAAAEAAEATEKAKAIKTSTDAIEAAMKRAKKPNITSGHTNLFRVIFISQNVYEIFTTKSSNRYVPYECDRYKRKTYIYKEGEETENYNYIRDISSSDITSSSQSEYEELYINDIYIPGSPKYKTLIEVVLEPSKRNTFNLSSEPAVPLNHELQNDNIYMYSESNILHVIMDEKPSIISIQDRFLDLLDIPSSSHDDIHKINDETYNIISTKNIYIKPQTRTPPSNKSDEQIS